MKNLLLTFVFAFIVMVAVAHNTEWQQTVKRLHTVCQADPNTKLQEVFVQRNRLDTIDVDHVAFHFRCMTTKMGWLNEDGTPNPEEVRKYLSKHIQEERKLEEATQKCTRKEKADNRLPLGIWGCISNFERGNQDVLKDNQDVLKDNQDVLKDQEIDIPM